LKAYFKKHTLEFITPGGTSRGVLKTKDTYFVILKDQDRFGIGECGLFRGLSCDDRPDYESVLQWTCDHIHLGLDELYNELKEFPSIQIGIETAFRSFESTEWYEIFPSEFINGNGISINGLIWMGDIPYMKDQIGKKIKKGFNCIKLKIGAIDFRDELNLLKSIRKEFNSEEIELRVDANGAFESTDALEKLKQLSEMDLHSIEQPIKKGQWQEMARLCEDSPLDIALDEELIGIFSEEKKIRLLKTINPQYIILKPSLIGGFRGSDNWIELAEFKKIGWWATSALESNIGLNAISQYTFTKNSKLPQGLGTGELFRNNITSPLIVRNGTIQYDTNHSWNVAQLIEE